MVASHALGLQKACLFVWCVGSLGCLSTLEAGFFAYIEKLVKQVNFCVYGQQAKRNKNYICALHKTTDNKPVKAKSS